MTWSASERRHFFDLLHALRDQELLPEQSEQLRSILSSDDDALALYLDHAYLMFRLHWVQGGLSRAQPHVSSPASRKEPTKMAARDSASSLLSFLGPAVNLGAHYLSSPKILALSVVGCLGTYFVGLMISIAVNRAFLADRQSQERSEPPAPAVQPADRDAACMARIARTSACEWRFERQSDRRSVGSPLVAGDILDIASGVVEVDFVSGAAVVLDGPTRFRIETAGRGFLLQGKLLGKVPPPARGFTVDTEEVRVVDLGTEFGVTADGSTQVEVFRGEVSLTRNQDQQKGIVTTRLAAGEAARVTRDGTVTAVTPRPEGYVGVGGAHTAPPSAESLLTDRFDGPELDASKWLVRTDILAGGAAVSIESGWLKLLNRGYLVSRSEFKPTPERPLRITGTCRIGTGDMLQVITRSDGVPDQQFGEVRQGVEFSFLNLDVDGFQINSRGPDIGVQRPKAGDQYAVEGKLVTAPSMTLRFEVIDAGANVSLTLSDLGNPANSETARAQVTLDRAAKHHVVLHNRERGGQEQTLFVGDLRIEQPARSGDTSSSDRPGDER